MVDQDPMQVLYHLSKTIEIQSNSLSEMQKDMHSIKIDIAVMKQTGVMPSSPEDMKKLRIKDSAAGGSIGAIVVTIIIGVWEYFKTKGT